MKVVVDFNGKGEKEKMTVTVRGLTRKQAEALADVGAEAKAVAKVVKGNVPEASKGKIASVLTVIGAAVEETLNIIDDSAEVLDTF